MKPERVLLLSSLLMTFMGEMSYEGISNLFSVVVSETHVREENAWNSAARMYSLLMTLAGSVPAEETPLMAGDRVLVRLNAPITAMAVQSEIGIIAIRLALLGIPPKRKIGGRDDLDKVHKVEGGLLRLLLSAIKRIKVMVSPRHVFRTKLVHELLRQLRTKAKLVNDMGEGMPTRRRGRAPVAG